MQELHVFAVEEIVSLGRVFQKSIQEGSILTSAVDCREIPDLFDHLAQALTLLFAFLIVSILHLSINFLDSGVIDLAISERIEACIFQIFKHRDGSGWHDLFSCSRLSKRVIL